MNFAENCGYCGNAEGQLLFPLKVAEPGTPAREFRLLCCPTCDLIYLAPRLSAEEIGAYYSETYYAKDQRRLKSVAEDILPGFRRADRVERHVKGGNILDVGCGGGGFLATLNHYPWRKFGWEVSDTAAVHARLRYGIDVRVGNLSDSGFRDSYFDVITLWHVFEHMASPAETLGCLHRLLKQGGLLLLAVPNFASLESRLTRANWYHLDVPRHYYHYTAATLRRMLESSGFQVRQVRHFDPKNGYGFLQSILNSMGFRKNLMRDWLSGRIPRITPKHRVQIAATLALLPALALGACAGVLLESALRMGGTIEVYATKH